MCKTPIVKSCNFALILSYIIILMWLKSTSSLRNKYALVLRKFNIWDIDHFICEKYCEIVKFDIFIHM